MRSLPFGHCCASAGAASATVSAAIPATAIHFHARIVDLLLLDWVTAGVLFESGSFPARLGHRLPCLAASRPDRVCAAPRWKIEWDGTLLWPSRGCQGEALRRSRLRVARRFGPSIGPRAARLPVLRSEGARPSSA